MLKKGSISMVDIKTEVKNTVKNIEGEVRSRTYRAGNILRKCALEVLSSKGGSRSGIRCKKPNSKARYTASAPGEPPARRTGNLRNSWKIKNIPFTVSAGNGFDTAAAIETNVEYDTYLEHGTSKMASRPHHAKIEEMAVPQIEQIFSDL